jgi:hypothetical protein
VCCFFYTFGRGDKVRPSLDYVSRTLANRAWDISRYYPNPEPLFWYSLRLIKADLDAPELQSLAIVLRQAVTERIGKAALENPIVLAIRLLICKYFNVPNKADLEALLQLQSEDGTWDGGWFFSFGKSQIRIQNKGLTAGMAVEAIRGALETESCTLYPPTLELPKSDSRERFLLAREEQLVPSGSCPCPHLCC